MNGLRVFFEQKKWKKIKKDQWLILFLAGILLLVIAVPTSCEESVSGSDTEGTDMSGSESTSADYEAELELRLENVLSCMDGVGTVEVMITFQDSGESVVEKDVTYSQEDSSSETDGVQESQRQSSEETVYSSDSDEGTPYVSKTFTPTIEGVLVVAEGGDDKSVAADISEAVEALFGVEAHKIKVVKMNAKREGSE